MPRINKTFVERKVQRPLSGQIIYRDNALIGFGLRVTRSSMSYIVECRVNGINRRITLGSHGRLNPETARGVAQKFLHDMSNGRDPREEQTKHKLARITLGDVLEDYLESRALRPNTIRSFKDMVRRCLGDWVSIPIANITREMIEVRHRELTKTTRQQTSGKAQANLAMVRLRVLINFAMNKYEIDGRQIIQKNPVNRLSQVRAWHRIAPRQQLIPDHKLPIWYATVISLKNTKIRDYLLLMLFTGLRRTEAATLKWSDVDLESRVLKVRAEIAKNHTEHRLPVTDFLCELLALRKNKNGGDSEFVFPGRGGKGHIVDSDHVIRGVAERCDWRFTVHDLRRSFLTTAESLEVPHYVLKKLANHISRHDITASYVVVTTERMRLYMEKISEHLLKVLGADIIDLK